MSAWRPRWRLLALAGIGAAFVVVLVVARRGAPTGDATGPPPPMRFDPDTVRQSTQPRIEVLNGSGITGLARKVTERLRAAGYDVVYYGNAGRGDPTRTVVLARTAADTATAARVGARLGITRIELAPDPARMVSVSVVLGEDWNGATKQKRPGS